VLGLALLAVLGSQATTVYAVLEYAKHEVIARAEQDLAEADSAFQDALNHRATALAAIMQPAARSPELQAAVRASDMAAMERILLSRIDQANADFGVLLDPTGKVLATSGSVSMTGLDYSALAGSQRELLITPDASYDMVTLPVATTAADGWLSIGYRIDDGLAQRLAKASGVEITLLRTAESGTISVLGSSLDTAERALLLTATEQIVAGQPFREATKTLGNYFRSARQSYLGTDNRVVVLTHKSFGEARQPFVALQGALLHASTISLLGALILALVLARAVTQPVRELLLATRRMSIGNYTQKLSIRSRDEFGELARAFETMREGIAQREQRIVYQAEFDPLTGLPNRIQATERLRAALRGAAKSGNPVVVMVMHLQRFREIQSSLGHEIGDEVLRQTAERLRGVMEPDHTLARLEGDQFLIVAPDTDKDGGMALARLLAGVLDAGLNVQSVNVTLDACIGFCVCPEHGRQPDELLRRAAVAKNDAQQSQKRIRYYQNGREARHVRQLAILGDLRRAVRENQLQLYLQPKVNLKTGQVCGAEALLRWDHPELGQIPPIEFIPLAERAGCIGMITQWVLGQAVAQCRAWRDEGIQLPIAVNFSAQDLLHDNLIPLIEAELDAHGMEAACLICEITEEAVLHDLDHAIAILNRLRKMGARTSMDDFGTGYSSLANLQKLPVDELKIDRTFVSMLPGHPQNAAIVRAIIGLAHNLGVEVVAEGVETTAALRWLREEGCERAQGYYLSKPMPADEFPGWLARWEQLNYEVEPGMDMTDSLILRPRLIK
jgi:diguanylate cyclase (GGDEF)-like protein